MGSKDVGGNKHFLLHNLDFCYNQNIYVYIRPQLEITGIEDATTAMALVGMVGSDWLKIKKTKKEPFSIYRGM